MNIKDTLIQLSDYRQYEEVQDILNSNGFKFVGCDFKSCLHIFVNSKTKLYSHTTGCNHGSEHIDFKKFMEKYVMTDLKSKIEEAKSKTHMSLHQMSKAIGFNEHYLSGVVKRNRSEKTQSRVIALLDDLIQKSQQELTHDFKGKALNTQVEDVVMVSNDEYDWLLKQVDHKTQVAEKHADMRAKAEAELQIANDAIKQQLTNVASKLLIIGELENKIKGKDELIHLAEQDSEKWQGDFWTVSRENVELINSKRTITICLAVSILVIVVMLVFGVLHFNGVV